MGTPLSRARPGRTIALAIRLAGMGHGGRLYASSLQAIVPRRDYVIGVSFWPSSPVAAPADDARRATDSAAQTTTSTAHARATSVIVVPDELPWRTKVPGA